MNKEKETEVEDKKVIEEPKEQEEKDLGVDKVNVDETEEKEIAPVNYKRFKQVNDEKKSLKEKNQELEQRLAEIEEQKAKDQEKALEDNEEFKTLAEQRKSEIEELKPKYELLEAKTKAQEKVIEKMVENSLGLIPDAFKSIFDKLDLLEKVDWLAENKEFLETDQKKISGPPKTPNPKTKTGLTDTERKRKTVRTF